MKKAQGGGASKVRRVLISALGISLLVPVLGMAATLGIIAKTLGAGAGGVTACDSTFGETYTTVSGNVTAVSVTGIADPSCEGGLLTVRLTGPGVDAGSSSTTIATDDDTADNSATVSFGSPPDGDLVNTVAISITGP
jgi:hypothetical protein